jgi:hypothetical protein
MHWEDTFSWQALFMARCCADELVLSRKRGETTHKLASKNRHLPVKAHYLLLEGRALTSNLQRISTHARNPGTGDTSATNWPMFKVMDCKFYLSPLTLLLLELH